MNPKPYVCETCSDTGMVVWTDDANIVRSRRCDPCPYRDGLRGFAPGVPVDEQDARLSTYDVTDDNRDAVKHAQFFIKAVHPGLYLWGGVGVGKTRLACVILNECHQQGERVLFVRTPEVLLKLQRLSGDDADAYLDRLIGMKVLVLDDVGASQGTDFARRMLQTIFDGRNDQGNRTVWTSNLSIDDLAEFLGDDRLPSRIAGQAKVVQVGGDDQRPRRMKARTAAKPASPAKRAGHSKPGW